MTQNDIIERVNILAEALDAVLNAYQEDIKDLFMASIAQDALPDRWFQENIKSRGPLWFQIARMACLSAGMKADGMEPETEEEHRYKHLLETISFLSLDFSNALGKALKGLEESEEE
nr:MAG TPA: hypothetical protein [Caudoviricetes sp.]